MAFSYNREDGQVSLKADGNVATLASEVGYLIHNLYSTMMHNNPLLGAAFKHMVQAAIFAPPTWEVRVPQEGDTDIMFEVPKEIFGRE